MHRQITKKIIESISTPDTRELLLRDTELKGFGVRISLSKTKTLLRRRNLNRNRQPSNKALIRAFSTHVF